MSLRVYVSYSGREDQVLALRLQTLATTRPGLHVYVPPASTRSRRGPPTGIDLAELSASNLILAIISGGASPTVHQEIILAQEVGKPLIPIVFSGRAKVAGLQPGQPVFYVDPFNPIEAENQIMDYLSTVQLGKTNQQSMLALILLLFGMLILAKE